MSSPHPEGRSAEMLGCCLVALAIIFGVAVGAALL